MVGNFFAHVYIYWKKTCDNLLCNGHIRKDLHSSRPEGYLAPGLLHEGWVEVPGACGLARVRTRRTGMLRKLMIIGGFAVAMAFSTGVAHADPITGYTNGSSCATCPGATYTLTVSAANASDLASGTNLTVTLTVTFDNPVTTTAADSYISAVAFKFGGNNITYTALTAAPGSTADWSTFANANTNSSSGDCAGSGAGWICSNDDGVWTDAAVSSGGVLTWTWTGVNLSTGWTTDPSNWSIQAKYNSDTGGTEGLLISDKLNVPEPGTLALLGIGLIPLLGFGRRFLG